MELPEKPLPPVTRNPSLVVIYAFTKSGKTTALSLLENNLLVDLEKGAEFLEAMRVDGSDFTKLRTVIQALAKRREEGKPDYPYISLDPVTRLDDIINPLAVENYMKSPIGKNFNPAKQKLMDLPNGAGYRWIREAFLTVVDTFAQYTPHLILSGHVRDKITQKGGVEVSSMELDLVGKLRNIISGRADAIGYLYRKENQTVVSFVRKSEDVIAGARPEHLAGKEIVLVEKQENGSFVAHWDRIFKSEN